MSNLQAAPRTRFPWVAVVLVLLIVSAIGAAWFAALSSLAANKGDAGSAADERDEIRSANAYDYARSFLRWTSTKNNHTPRLQVDAACTLTRDGESKEYFLSTMC